LSEVETVYIGENHKPYRLKSSRLHTGVLLISVEGCEDRDEADALRGELVSVPMADAVRLKAGEYYHHQIVGLKVVTDMGEDLGSVTEIIQTGANDVYVVKSQTGEVLLPAIKSVILKIDPPLMMVHLMDGLR
jgi:16S rRNA processing protein RimM